MSEMIERVARALAKGAAWRLQSSDAGFMELKYPGGESAYIEEQWPLYVNDARLALEALPLAPTPAMLKAGNLATVDTYGNLSDSFGVSEHNLKQAWPAMVRTLLGTPEPT